MTSLEERFGRPVLGTHWLQSSRWYWTETESEAAWAEGRRPEGVRVETFLPVAINRELGRPEVAAITTKDGES